MKAVFQRKALPDCERLRFMRMYQLKGHPQIFVSQGWQGFTYWEITIEIASGAIIDLRKSFATLKEARQWLSNDSNVAWCYQEIETIERMVQHSRSSKEVEI